MKLTSLLFRLARLSADVGAINKSMKMGSASPLIKRGTNKLIGRKLVSKAWWK
jgi:hypothetical protein